MPKDVPDSFSSRTADAILHGAFERLRPRLLAMIHRRIGPKLATHVDPEGVVQEAYDRAWTRWPGLDPKPKKLDAWVYGQVRDRLIERIRSALGPEHDVGREVPGADDPAGGLAGLLVDSQTGPISALSRAERQEMVRQALAKLKPIDREVLEFRYFDGMEFDDIGTIVGLSENAANRRALRAMMKLRDLVPPEYQPPEARKP